MPAKTPKSPRRNVAVAKVPQPHGGALLAGGVPGHKGGGGRPPSVVRAAALEGAALAIPKLIAQLDAEEVSVSQGAADKLLKYGLGTQRDVRLTVDDLRERLSNTVETIRRLAPADVAERIISAIKEHWTS